MLIKNNRVYKYFFFILAVILLLQVSVENILAKSSPNLIYIKDGDSFILKGKEIRLWGIDAPELFQICYKNKQAYECGQEAKKFLEKILNPQLIKCERQKKKYKEEKRMIARCFVNDQDIAEIMVKNGWAIDYTFFSNGFYKNAENIAKTNKLGIWAGEHITPRQWRKLHPRK